MSAAMTQKKLHTQRKRPQTWGGHMHHVFESLIREGFFKLPNKKAINDIVDALEARGLSTKGRESKIANSLNRRVKKGILKKAKTKGEWFYWTE